ncbi:MAG: 16S rRNA (cytidine(1402)-2'-O)-methyltransferase [Bacteroidota bacterium]
MCTVSTLFIVATPIGNLDDFSPRAVSVLNAADYIACEDTRTSSRLLKHYGIHTPTFSFHQHNEHKKVHYVLQLLEGNQSVALISDAGMPGISDPGFLAIREARKKGYPVEVIPGADAVTTALVSSGLPTERYIFEGFLPHKKGRQKRIQALIDEQRTVVFYESPHRILKLLGEIEEHLGADRMVAVCRELTKKFEEVQRGLAKDVRLVFAKRESIKGEIVVVIAGKGYTE